MTLYPAEQSTIRLAIGLRRVDSADVPPTAKAPDLALSTLGPSQGKHTAKYEASLAASQGFLPQSDLGAFREPLWTGGGKRRSSYR
ncbi:hypothetical protein BD414DRAFT_539409 [Trametes punicea]|nr:hypothetical protein BD414DRAFT_539409 [Trametes punicea]